MWIVLLPLANAFTLNGLHWPEYVPVQVRWTGTLSGLDHDESAATVQAAADEWTSHAPCGFSYTVVEDDNAAEPGAYVSVLMDDPLDEVAVGVLEVTYVMESSGFAEVPSVTIVMNDQVTWVTDADIDAGACTGGYSAQGVLTHALGSALGLGPSDDTDATMYSATGVPAECDDGASSLGDDDIRGLEALFSGGTLGVDCDPDPDDSFAITCTLTDEGAGLDTPTWDFGDGVTEVGPTTVTHRYANIGEYAIEACVTVAECDRPACRLTSFQALSYPYAGGAPPLPPVGCAAVQGPPTLVTAAFAGWLLARRRRPTDRPPAFAMFQNLRRQFW